MLGSLEYDRFGGPYASNEDLRDIYCEQLKCSKLMLIRLAFPTKKAYRRKELKDFSCGFGLLSSVIKIRE